MPQVAKRTKIVCTLGPASEDVRTILSLGQAGMDVARFNFSHGVHEWHSRVLKRLRQAESRLGRPIAVLQDVHGRKIRVGDLPAKGVLFRAGNEVVFTTDPHPATGDIPVSLPQLPQAVKRNARILLDDGLLECVVRRVSGHRVHCEVVTGGTLLPHKGLNLPGTTLNLPALTDQGREDVAWGVKNGVDFIALSFVRTPGDIKDLRNVMNRTAAGRKIKLIGKIEKQEAIDRFDELLPLMDAVMIGRGDLGIETSAAKLPVVQKQIVARCREKGVPVIVATQMLDSMQKNPRPTRAEASDVANAVADHADAVMLSGETSTGKYPLNAVRFMAETIRAMEASAFDDLNAVTVTDTDSPELAGMTARLVSDALGHAPIVIVSPDGGLAREAVSARPETAIHVVTADPVVRHQLCLSWGVTPHLVSAGALKKTSSILSALARARALRRGTRAVFMSEDRVEIIKT